MRKVKGLLMFGALAVAGVVAYRKLKNSDEEDFAKAVSKTVREKVDETMKDRDVTEMINKKAQEVVRKISFEKTLDRLGDKFMEKLLNKARREIEKKITHNLFWGWLDE